MEPIVPEEDLASSNRALARMMIGDEKLIQQIEGEVRISALESSKSPRDAMMVMHSPTSIQKTESEFMQTNASIFDRNPFKDFTTHKLSEFLQQKDGTQLAEMREEALHFGEMLETEFIDRLEHKK
jgi:hypothetical protein